MTQDEDLGPLYDRFAETIRALERTSARGRGSKREKELIARRDALRRRLERLEGVDDVPSYGASWEGYR